MRKILAFGCALLGCANGNNNGGGLDAPRDGAIADTFYDVSFDLPAEDASTDDASDASASDASSIDGDLPDGACAAVTLATKRSTPNVFFVIDRSGSMTMKFTGSPSRWAAIEDALIGVPSGVVTKLEDVVRFGALMYSDDPDVPGCPDVDTTPAVIKGGDGIGALYATNFPSGNTPTGDSIDHVLKNLDTLIPSLATDPSILVLATDGEPATCADSTDVTAGRAYVVDRVTAAHAEGLDTYVISVGVGIANKHLQDVANAGRGVKAGDPAAPYYVATDLTGFETALKGIIGGILTCTVELVGKIDPGAACEGTVTLDGSALACGKDWKAVDGNHIELLGSACDKLKSKSTSLVASFPCNVIR